jgi:hypothetical protein
MTTKEKIKLHAIGPIIQEFMSGQFGEHIAVGSAFDAGYDAAAQQTAIAVKEALEGVKKGLTMALQVVPDHAPLVYNKGLKTAFSQAIALVDLFLPQPHKTDSK